MAQVGRRGFLGLMAAAPVAAPAAIEEMKMQMAQAASLSKGSYIGSAMNIACGAEKASSWIEPDDAVRKAFRMGLISREKLLELISAAGPLGYTGGQVLLDADLVAAKSFSMVAKMRMQEERNRDRQIERFLEKPRNLWDYGRELVEKKLISEDRP
jgi:hypothetical protein